LRVIGLPMSHFANEIHLTRRSQQTFSSGTQPSASVLAQRQEQKVAFCQVQIGFAYRPLNVPVQPQQSTLKQILIVPVTGITVQRHRLPYYLCDC
jgi:hypothetical protein